MNTLRRMPALCLLTVCTLLLLPMAACSGGEEDPGEATAETTREQRDSAIADLPLPGSQGVRGAIDARDAANARAEAHDTIR